MMILALELQHICCYVESLKMRWLEHGLKPVGVCVSFMHETSVTKMPAKFLFRTVQPLQNKHSKAVRRKHLT